MNFSEAFEIMKKGYKVKLPSWHGYWCWENDTIMMYCKDGKVLDIRETEVVDYTFSNIASDEWIVADDENTPYFGGIALFGFNEAIKYLKRGLKVARRGWNGKCMWLELQVPTEQSKMTLPYIYMKTACNNFVPWLASQTDMLADDWQIVE